MPQKSCSHVFVTEAGVMTSVSGVPDRCAFLWSHRRHRRNWEQRLAHRSTAGSGWAWRACCPESRAPGSGGAASTGPRSSAATRRPTDPRSQWTAPELARGLCALLPRFLSALPRGDLRQKPSAVLASPIEPLLFSPSKTNNSNH